MASQPISSPLDLVGLAGGHALYAAVQSLGRQVDYLESEREASAGMASHNASAT